MHTHYIFVTLVPFNSSKTVSRLLSCAVVEYLLQFIGGMCVHLVPTFFYFTIFVFSIPLQRAAEVVGEEEHQESSSNRIDHSCNEEKLRVPSKSSESSNPQINQWA